MLDRKSGERREALLVRRFGESIQRNQRALGFGARKPCGVVQAARRFDGGDDGVELGEATLLDCEADSLALRLGSVFECVYERQGGLAFGEIITQILTALRGVR